MSDPIRFVGLDVHATSISIAVATGSDPAEYVAKIPNDLARLLKSLDRLGARERLRCAYEAGPTGYGLYRSLREAGISSQVIAPSKMPKASGDRVKTDRRDAIRLAHLLRCGDLTNVHVPDETCEAMRDLLRAREDAKRAQLRARHQLGKFLLRHGRRWPRSNWTKAHIEWVEQQRFDEPAQGRVLQEYLHTVNEATARSRVGPWWSPAKAVRSPRFAFSMGKTRFLTCWVGKSSRSRRSLPRSSRDRRAEPASCNAALATAKC